MTNLRHLEQRLEELKQRINRDREEYKKIVKTYYEYLDRNNELFPLHREENRENFKRDLIEYDKLVTHCLRADDTELLYTFGINPLALREGLLRLASSNMTLYRDAFQVSMNKSQHPFERMCYLILMNSFQSLI
ncbi:hypothetical protein [Scytonema sp. NUACC26]|uniref:hypothetical protein n=1 Tax=Scytonema sp. NUACC26 TaxID=3140176 RepID=UPI0034DC952E